MIPDSGSWPGMRPWMVATFLCVPIVSFARVLISHWTFSTLGIAGRLARGDIVPTSLLGIFFGHIDRGETGQAAAIYLPSQVGWALVVGPLVTLAIILVANSLVAKGVRSPWVFATGLAAPAPMFLALVGALGVASLPASMDEVRLAAIIGRSPALVVGVSTLLASVAWLVLALSVPERQRRTAFPGLAAGLVLGTLLYRIVLVPWLL